MDGESPDLHVRHLLVCQEAVRDAANIGAVYSLRGLTTTVRPPDDDGYPVVCELLDLFVQLYGTPGRYAAHADLVLVDDGAGEESLVQSWGPHPVVLTKGRFVAGAVLTVGGVQFPESGVYEFRLRIAGFEEPLAGERLLAEAIP